jgi:hypothetical protein
MTDRTPDTVSKTLREQGGRYVVDTQSRPVAVLLTLEEYEHYLDLLDDEEDSQDEDFKPAWLWRLFRRPTLRASPCATISANIHPPMPRYKVEFLDRRAQRELDRVPEPDFSRVAAALLKLVTIVAVKRRRRYLPVSSLVGMAVWINLQSQFAAQAQCVAVKSIHSIRKNCYSMVA